MSESKASVSINLSSELRAGDRIIGDFILKNIGTVKGRLRIFIDPTWLPNTFTVNKDLEVNQTLKLGYGLYKMPDHDVSHIVKGYHLKNGEWILDDTKTH